MVKAQRTMQQIGAAKQARQYARQQRINQLMAGGAKPEEAFLAAATEFADDPKESLAYIQAAQHVKALTAPPVPYGWIDDEMGGGSAFVTPQGKVVKFNAPKAPADLQPRPALPPTELTTKQDEFGNTFYWSGRGWTHVPNQAIPKPASNKPQPEPPGIKADRALLFDIQKAINKGEGDPNELNRKANIIQQRILQFEKGTPTAAPVAATPAPATTVKEVTRKTKDGRTAVFNADTKEFLRYAD